MKPMRSHALYLLKIKKLNLFCFLLPTFFSAENCFKHKTHFEPVEIRISFLLLFFAGLGKFWSTYFEFINSVTGITKSLVKFNANGDPPGRYTIYQYQRSSEGKYGYIPIGNWTSGLQVDLSMAKWKNGSTSLPISVCSDPCPSGYIKSSEGTCCWTCIRCNEDEVLCQSNDIFKP